MDNNTWLIYLILYVGGFIGGIFLTRWIFRIDILVEYQKKQYMILRQIAQRSGVDEELIEEIDNLK